MVHGAGNAKADVELRLDHHAGLSHLQLVREQLAIHDRPCAGELPAQQLCQLAVFVQTLVLQPRADAHDRLAACNVQLRVKCVRRKAEELCADVLHREGDLLVDDGNLSLLAGRDVFERSRTDGAHLRAQLRDRDNRHDLAARRRLHKLNVCGLRVVDQLRSVARTAGLQPRREPGRKVAAVGRAAHEHCGGIVLLAQHGEQVGVRFRIIALVPRAGHLNDPVHAARPDPFDLRFRKRARDDRDQPVAGLVAELAHLAAKLQRHRMHRRAVVLDVDPHVFVAFLIHHAHLLSPGSARRASPRWLPRCPRRSSCRAPAGRAGTFSAPWWASRGRRCARGPVPECRRQSAS